MWLALGSYSGPRSAHAFVMFMLCKWRDRERVRAFASYVCDSLMYAPQGMYITKRFTEMLEPSEEIDVDAVIDRVVSKATRGDGQ